MGVTKQRFRVTPLGVILPQSENKRWDFYRAWFVVNSRFGREAHSGQDALALFRSFTKTIRAEVPRMQGLAVYGYSSMVNQYVEESFSGRNNPLSISHP